VSSGLGLTFDDAELEKSVRTGVGDVESALRAAVRSDDEFVGIVAVHLVKAGGKRFRPLLAVLAAHFGDPSGAGVVPAAVVVELTHLATLYHDDVMDEAAVRRGAASANARYGNTVAILTGDFLFSRASNLLAELGADAVRIQARTFERLVVGQIQETMGPGEGDDPIEHYLSVLAGKTGSLIATAAQFGAMFAGVDAATTDVLRRLGEEIGVAFQLSDDILDIASESATSGKTPGTDLREGVATLPVLYALAPGDESAPAKRLRALVGGPIEADDDVTEALALLRESAGMNRARSTLAAYADRARALLVDLPDVPARAALAALIDLTVTRSA
jgi:heptaprenyl diphosphate synthase